ncbi:MAG: DNA-binding transcriptional MocR family regulator [Myxococcota bacterium]|jgi:DNA-binding transcriptional MocR family regulator
MRTLPGLARCVAWRSAGHRARGPPKVYTARQEFLVDLLRRLPVQVDVPAGGLALWVRTPGIDADRWAEAALEHGTGIRTGRSYRLDGASEPAFRAGFASLDEAGLTRAVAGLEAACPA